MRKLSAVAFVVITIMITVPLPAIAYTQADADACTPDAMRLCASLVKLMLKNVSADDCACVCFGHWRTLIGRCRMSAKCQ